MTVFTYQAIDQTGKPKKGIIDCPSKDLAADKLSRLNLIITSIGEQNNFFSLNTDIFADFATVKTTDIVMFTIQLSNMLGAGIPLSKALSILIEQTENPKLKYATKEICESINKGATFSDALGKHPKIFSVLFVNMIAAGETTGNLEEVLLRLSKFAEREADLKQKLATAMMYPAVLTVMGIAVVLGVVLFLLPSFVSIYTDAKINLPFPTKVLFSLNIILRKYWHVIIGSIALFIFGYRWYAKTNEGKMIVDNIKLQLPLWGSLIRKITVSRLSRTLSTLIAGGVPMIQSLEITSMTIENEVIGKVIKNVIGSVSRGEGISSALKESGQFPPMAVQMIGVGEETGTLETMLSKVADYYDIETDYSLKRITSMLEPIFLVVIGGAVGFIFASIVLPIFEMAKSLRH